MRFVVQKISIAEFDELEKQIFDNDQTFDQMYETWKILDDFFGQNFYDNDLEWRMTYFRVYVRLTWKMLGALDRAKFVEIIRRQAPMALLLDVDVLTQIMWYLGFNIADKQALVSLFLELKKEFLQSEAVVGVWRGKNVSVAELVKEIDSVYRSGDSLAVADFESRLRQIMFPDEESKKYFVADPEQAKERFLDLVSFFETFTPENIWYVVDAFLSPGKYQNVPAGEAPPAPAKTPTPPAPKPASSNPPLPRPSGELPKPLAHPQSTPKKEEPKLVVPPTIRLKPSPAQVKSQIESQFKKDVDGNFIDVEGVMAKLNELAEKNNDPKIAEMYYFDEKENKFKWNL